MFINILALRCGVYLRAAFIRGNTVGGGAIRRVVRSPLLPRPITTGDKSSAPNVQYGFKKKAHSAYVMSATDMLAPVS